MEQVERGRLDRLQDAQVPRALPAPAFLRGHEGPRRHVGGVEEPVRARGQAEARVLREGLRHHVERARGLARRAAQEAHRLLAPAAGQHRQDHRRGEDRPDDRHVGADRGADEPERLELLAERALAGIGGGQARQVVGRSHRRVRDRVLLRLVAGRRVGQPPHLGEALGARLRLEEVPVEGTREPQRLVGQALRRVLGREVVEPERERDPVDRLAPERRAHPLPLGHHAGRAHRARPPGASRGAAWEFRAIVVLIGSPPPPRGRSPARLQQRRRASRARSGEWGTRAARSGPRSRRPTARTARGSSSAG